MVPSQCNVCGGRLQLKYPKVVDPQSKETFGISVCERCELGHTTPQPDDLSRYYGQAYHGNRHGFTARYCAWRREGFVESVLGKGGGKKLLDIGCGDGTFLEGMQKKGWTGVGTEMNPAIAREAGLTVFESLKDAADEGPYDCITTWHSLEHMRDPAGTIVETAKLLKDDGALFIAVPNAQGWQAKVFGARWFHLDVPRHLFHFGDASMAALLQKAGLTQAKRWDQEFELDLFGWLQSALNSVLPDPNLFFYHLTGRASGGGSAQLALSYALGSAVGAAALPTVPAATLMQQGGTLIIAARKGR
ncbi:MAG: class I SAM-dependent methyltransferase [Myxococcaceae bacterium]|nr:class I SAM-dependent methyltransferase [Myxococcaceae bacterium]